MKILITGTKSFIGTNFRRYSKFRNVTELSFLNVEPIETDFDGYNIILHLAAIVHQDKKIPESEYLKVNRDLTSDLAQKAKKAGVGQFIFMSTSKVYGNKINSAGPWKEDTACYPDDPYGKSKYEAEQELKRLETHDFTVSIIRTPVVYGPGVKANFLQLTKLIEKSPFLPFAGINNNRHFTYIENLIGFIDRIIETRASGTFITMDPSGISTSDLVLKIAQKLNPTLINFKLPKTLLNTVSFMIPLKTESLFGSFLLDNAKTRNVLNYEPPFTSEEGIKKFCDYYFRSKSNL